jgi:hypothetical protein
LKFFQGRAVPRRANKRHLFRGQKQPNKRLIFAESGKEMRKMNFLRQILFTALVVIGFSLTASAQRQPEEKKKPPKPHAEIKPEEKKPPRNNDNRDNRRNNENKPKKPQTFFLISENRIEITST